VVVDLEVLRLAQTAQQLQLRLPGLKELGLKELGPKTPSLMPREQAKKVSLPVEVLAGPAEELAQSVATRSLSRCC
jgi:hypothetical protein